MRQKPTIVKRQVAAESTLFYIEALDLAFSNGQTRRFERIRGRGHGSVMMVPLLDEDTVLLVREYAAGLDRYELALPKGLMEVGETPEEAANRELMEEVGYGGGRWDHIHRLSTSPGHMSAQVHVMLARDLYERRLPGDEPEEIEVVPWSLNRLSALWEQDDVSDARSIAALYLVRDRLMTETQGE